jgi:hypothetical protein
MKNPAITDPDTFEQTMHGWWIVTDYKDEIAIGMMYGCLTTCPTTGYNKDGYRIDYGPKTGIVTLVTWMETYYFKPITQAEFESAIAFQLGTEFNADDIPLLLPKFPEEIPLDTPSDS